MPWDLQVFNKQTYAAMTETVAQDIDKFNEASQGAIQLINEPFGGDFNIEASFKAIAGLVRRRNAYGSGTITAKRLEQMLDVAVKVAAGTPPLEYEKQQYTWILQNPELAAITIGEQLGKARLADMLNAGILGASSAISSNVNAVHGAGTDAADFRLLNKGAAKLGDRSGAIRSWILHSTTMHNLFDNALTNSENLFRYDGVNVVRDPFGRVQATIDQAKAKCEKVVAENVDLKQQIETLKSDLTPGEPADLSGLVPVEQFDVVTQKLVEAEEKLKQSHGELVASQNENTVLKAKIAELEAKAKKPTAAELKATKAAEEAAKAEQPKE